MPGFELGGAAGRAAVQGMGILFLMWNVPYTVAFWNPIRFYVALYEAVVMQAIGAVGESLLLAGIGEEHLALRDAISRFIFFDGAGLIALAAAAWMIYRWLERTGPKN